MATVANGSVPTVKVESAIDGRVKEEPMDEDTVPYMDDQDDEGGDLDFAGAKRDVWLGHVPRNLWNVLSSLGSMADEDEIEIGTIRTEGLENRPQRISLMLNNRLPQLATLHKEYNLFETPAPERRNKRKAGTFIFSEQDVEGYRPRKFNFDDLDEDGNPSQAMSQLFAKYKRTQNNKKRRAEKENDPEAAQPRTQRKIPKKTSIQGVVSKEFDLRPVKNADYLAIEALQAGSMLHQKKKQEAVLIKSLKDVLHMEGIAEQQQATRNAVKKKAAAEKQSRKDNQTQRMDKQALQTTLHHLFAKHRIWRIRDLRIETNQPENYLREVLQEMAFMHGRGDWTGMWEMKKDYRDLHLAEMQGQMEGDVAPERSDVDMMDDEDTDGDSDAFVPALE